MKRVYVPSAERVGLKEEPKIPIEISLSYDEISALEEIANFGYETTPDLLAKWAVRRLIEMHEREIRQAQYPMARKES